MVDLGLGFGQGLLAGLPEGVCGDRSEDHDRLFLYRMLEFEPPRVQVNPAIGIGTIEAVFQVAFYGVADDRELAPDLMVPPGLETDLEQAVAIQATQDLVVQHCPFGVGARLGKGG